MDNECWDCAYFIEDNIKDKSYCTKNETYIESDDICEQFELPKICQYCRHHKETVYESGTIDDIEYCCKLQDNKLIYDDLSPYSQHTADFPKCPIDKYEKLE